MRNNEWLKQTTQQLAGVGIESARLDSLILLEDESGKDRAWLLAHPELELSEVQVVELNKKVTRRAGHIPLAYIRGHVEFYGRQFIVNEHVLVPRPESETMIGLLLSLTAPNSVIVDIGTGSGVLAISAKLELSAANVIGMDIDSRCLEVARRNATLLGADVSFIESDLADGIGQKPDIILANLPYVPDNYDINRAAGHEPGLALYGGQDGLELYRQTFFECSKKRMLPEYMLTESLPEQHVQLTSIAMSFGYTLEISEGFIQLFKLRV